MIEILGYSVDPEAGLVYGPRGCPIGSPDSCGYLQIDGRSRGFGVLSVHRLVWEAANGPIPDDKEINHIDGVKTHNWITNLELVTHAENIRHAYRTGLKTNRGEKHPSNRLSESQVREIRKLRASGRTVTAIGRQFGVTPQTVSHIARRKTWTHLGD